MVGERFSVSFQRTLRIPEDGQTYPLPPTLGPFSIHRVADFAEKMPAGWRQPGAFFVPMYQREALWLGFGGEDWKPNAVVVEVGGVNAISGEVGAQGLQSSKQNYLVTPDQPWLDGINAGDGFIHQFVATPLGVGLSVEGQITGTEDIGGLQLTVYEPKPGSFPDEPPQTLPYLPYQEAMGMEMGLGAGGRITQKIHLDPYGIDVWDQANCETVRVFILNSQQYREVTGLEPPPTAVSVDTYVEYGLPWFELYDESARDVPAASSLAGLKTVAGAVEAKQKFTAADLPTRRIELRDGNAIADNTKGANQDE